ncbi:hypothetical protein Tco_0453035 [Tanacetum coccineum]
MLSQEMPPVDFAGFKNLMTFISDTKEQKITPQNTFLDLKNPIKVNSKKEITESFPLETLGMGLPLWEIMPHGLPISTTMRKILVIKGMQEAFDILKACHSGPTGDTTVQITPLKRSSTQDFIGPQSTRMPMTLLPNVTFVNVKAKFSQTMRCHKTLSKFAKS